MSSANEKNEKISEGFIVLKPLGDRVLVEVTQAEEQTVSGFVLASAAKE